MHKYSKTAVLCCNCPKSYNFAAEKTRIYGNMRKKIAVFASGSGTNFQQICEYFQQSDKAQVDILIVNKKDAYVRERAKALGIEQRYFTREDFYNSDKIVDLLTLRKTDLIVLAGFLWLVPQNLLAAFPNKIVNIHPAACLRWQRNVRTSRSPSSDCRKGKQKRNNDTLCERTI